MDTGFSVTLAIDSSELQSDLKRIERGELTLPTVSAVKAVADGFEENVPIWLAEQ